MSRFTHTQDVKEFRLGNYATDTVTSERFKINKFVVGSEGEVLLQSTSGEQHLLSVCIPGPSNKGLFKKKNGVTKRDVNRARKLSLEMSIGIDGALVVLKQQRKDRKRRETVVRQKKHADSLVYMRTNGKYAGGKKPKAAKTTVPSKAGKR